MLHRVHHVSIAYAERMVVGSTCHCRRHCILSCHNPVMRQKTRSAWFQLWCSSVYRQLDRAPLNRHAGPEIKWRPGRSDALDGNNIPPDGRLPDASKDAKHIRWVFEKMGCVPILSLTALLVRLISAGNEMASAQLPECSFKCSLDCRRQFHSSLCLAVSTTRKWWH